MSSDESLFENVWQGIVQFNMSISNSSVVCHTTLLFEMDILNCIVCICSAQSENRYDSGIVPAHCENSYFVRRFRNCTRQF